MRAIWVNSKDQTVTEVDCVGLEDLQNRVGGFIEMAYQWPNQDVLFVDEEGLLKGDFKFCFLLLERTDQPFIGNGIIIGTGRNGETRPAKHTWEQIKSKIIFGTVTFDGTGVFK